MLVSCMGQDAFIGNRVNTSDKFIECLMHITPNKILSYRYPNVDDKICNKNSRDFYVSTALKFIKKFGLGWFN